MFHQTKERHLMLKSKTYFSKCQFQAAAMKVAKNLKDISYEKKTSASDGNTKHECFFEKKIMSHCALASYKLSFCSIQAAVEIFWQMPVRQHCCCSLEPIIFCIHFHVHRWRNLIIKQKMRREMLELLAVINSHTLPRQSYSH